MAVCVAAIRQAVWQPYGELCGSLTRTTGSLTPRPYKPLYKTTGCDRGGLTTSYMCKPYDVLMMSCVVTIQCYVWRPYKRLWHPYDRLCEGLTTGCVEVAVPQFICPYEDL